MKETLFQVSIGDISSTYPLPQSGSVDFRLDQTGSQVASALTSISLTGTLTPLESEEASGETHDFPLWVGGENVAQKQATMQAHKDLGESPADQKVRAAIAKWGKMSPELQKDFQIRFQDNLWLLDAPFCQGMLINSQGWVRKNLPAEMLTCYEDGEKKQQQFKEKGYTQHNASAGIAVHFTRESADEYVASQENNNIDFADFTDEQIAPYRSHLRTLLGIDCTSFSLPRSGDLCTEYMGEYAFFWVRTGGLRVCGMNAKLLVDNDDNKCGYSLLLRYAPQSSRLLTISTSHH